MSASHRGAIDSAMEPPLPVDPFARRCFVECCSHRPDPLQDEKPKEASQVLAAETSRCPVDSASARSPGVDPSLHEHGLSKLRPARGSETRDRAKIQKIRESMANVRRAVPHPREVEEADDEEKASKGAPADGEGPEPRTAR